MLKRISPTRLIMYSFLAWFVAYLIIPADYIVKGNRFFPLFMLIGYNVCIILGFLSIKKNITTKIVPTTLDFFSIKLSFCIGVLGFILNLIQLLFIQKIFSVNVYEQRLSNQYTEFNSGILGVLIALTFPFAIVAFLSIFYYKNRFSNWMKVISSLFALLYVFDAYLNGARLPIVVIVIMSVIVFVFYQENNELLSKKKILFKLGKIQLIKVPKILMGFKALLFLIVLILGINFFKEAMVKRLEYYQYDDVLTYWEGQHESKINKNYKKEINSLKINEKNQRIATYSLYHYIVHAPFEFQKLVNHLDAPFGTFYGKYELDVYFKFLRFLKIPVQSRMDMEKKLYHEGYYITFWGPFYLDFGIFGFIIAYFLGLAIKITYNLATRAYLPAILMYSYVAIVLLASFHVSLFGGKYIYIFNAILFFWIFNGMLKASQNRKIFNS